MSKIEKATSEVSNSRNKVEGPTFNDLRRGPGREAAWRTLIQTQSNSLFAQALRYTSGDYQRAEDLVQTTYEKLSMRLDKDTPPVEDNVGGFLFTTLKNTAINQARSDAVRPKTVSLDANYTDASDLSGKKAGLRKEFPSDMNVEEEVQNKKNGKELVKVLTDASIYPVHLDALLKHADGFSNLEISAGTNKVPRTVATSLFRGRAAARQALENVVDPKAIEGRVLRKSS
ncbi:MAG TPA: RNA polymerase sigma factor [Methylomirabilota bacterium]|nr:RNA polymerase sigma factor [Methylomirabilota bacterium]